MEFPPIRIRFGSPEIAVVLLGAAELLAVDVSAPYFYALAQSGLTIFEAFTGVFVLFTSLSLFWSVLKEHAGRGAVSGMKEGAANGFVSALPIILLIALSSAMGRGLARVSAGWGGAGFPYVEACMLALAAYCLLGAGAGLLAGIAMKPKASAHRHMKK